jgi:hypothetical protein
MSKMQEDTVYASTIQKMILSLGCLIESFRSSKVAGSTPFKDAAYHLAP